MDWRQYIHTDPNILSGRPVVEGTRLAVEFLLGLYGAGWIEARLLETVEKACRAVKTAATKARNLPSQVNMESLYESAKAGFVNLLPRLQSPDRFSIPIDFLYSFLENYPHLTLAALRAVHAYAGETPCVETHGSFCQ